MKLLIFLIINFLITILPILLAVAFLTLLERKFLASIQLRRGPFIVGFLGILQPLADGLKLFIKESIIPNQASSFIFLMAPLITFSVSLIGWVIIPFNINVVFADIDLGILFFLAISSLAVYGIVIAGWSSNSKYAFLGALRSTAQMISYEVSLSLILLNVLVFVDSLNVSELINSQEFIWFIVPFMPVFFLFFISALAETNRPPFDLPEAETELVAGYIVEYASLTFAFFFIGEYSNIILSSFLIVILFFAGWGSNNDLFILNYYYFFFKILLIMLLFILIRATLPRYRYDQLMQLGWKFILPIVLGLLFYYFGLFLFFNY